MLFPAEINFFRRKARVMLGALGLLLALGSCAPTAADGAGSCARADLAFGGDVLLHALIQSDAAARPEGFAPAFAPLAGPLSRAAVTVVNLEGPTARNIVSPGREVADPGTLFDGRVYAGYPLFNYHPAIADALRGVGVDVVQTANNHAMDRGSIGADRTLSTLVGAGLATTGTHPRGAGASWHTTRRVSGFNIAFLACTFSTNGLADPGQQVLGCYGNRPSIPTLIHTLTTRPEIDGVVLLPHWGVEYSARPTARQRQLARAAAEAGAIAVVGAHPHVLQPMEVLQTADGRRVPVAYSLGNLISSQWRLEQRTGALLYLDLSATDRGLEATNARYLPTRVERTTVQGVAVFPAASLVTGAPSLAHAQRILGPDVVTPGGCRAR